MLIKNKLLLDQNELTEAIGHLLHHLAEAVGINIVSLDGFNACGSCTVHYSKGRVGSHNHDAGAEGIGDGCSGSHHGDAEHVMCHRLTCAGIDGVLHGATVGHMIALPIAARGGHGAVRDLNNVLHLPIGEDGALNGFVDAHVPLAPSRAMTCAIEFASELNHKIDDTMLAKHLVSHVYASSLGQSVGIDEHTGIGL